MTKPVRILSFLIIANLGLSVAFAASSPSGPPSVRPLLTTLIAAACAVSLGGLAAGSARAYRWIRIFSIAGMIGGTGLFASGEFASGLYPAWAGLLGMAQAVTAVAVFAATHSRAVRAEFGEASCGRLVPRTPR